MSAEDLTIRLVAPLSDGELAALRELVEKGNEAPPWGKIARALDDLKRTREALGIVKQDYNLAMEALEDLSGFVGTVERCKAYIRDRIDVAETAARTAVAERQEALGRADRAQARIAELELLAKERGDRWHRALERAQEAKADATDLRLAIEILQDWYRAEDEPWESVEPTVSALTAQGAGVKRLALEREMLGALRDATDRFGPRTPTGRRIREAIAMAEAVGLQGERNG